MHVLLSILYVYTFGKNGKLSANLRSLANGRAHLVGKMFLLPFPSTLPVRTVSFIVVAGI